MAPQMQQQPDLAWLLDDLMVKVVGVARVVVLSNDGLLLAASRGLHRDDAETIAAAASGLQSLARSNGAIANAGALRQTMVEYEQGNLFVCAAGPNACLAAQSTAEVDVGVLAFELARLVTSVGRYLSTPQRTAAQATSATLAQ